MATSFFYIYVMATSLFYIYAMATSFFFIFFDIYMCSCESVKCESFLNFGSHLHCSGKFQPRSANTSPGTHQTTSLFHNYWIKFGTNIDICISKMLSMENFEFAIVTSLNPVNADWNLSWLAMWTDGQCLSRRTPGQTESHWYEISVPFQRDNTKVSN